MTRRQEASDSVLRPYRGAEPYRFEHGEFFFGRDAASRVIVEKILGTPVTILHAPSGAGKTSLLNARVLPGLEANGLTPILMRLWESPVDSARHEIAHQVFPEPAREVECMEVAQKTAGLTDATGLADAVERFDSFRQEDASRAARVLGAIRGEIPFLARLFNRTLDLERYIEALNFVSPGLLAPGEFPASRRQVPIGDLKRTLSEPGAIQAHADLVSSLGGEDRSLAELVTEVCELCGALRDFELVLCFDQFEEIFTRFHTSTAESSRDERSASGSWVREEFFAEIKKLCRAVLKLDGQRTVAGRATSRHRLPVRLLFSLRDEFFARMDWLSGSLRGGFVGSHHLNLFSPPEARLAIVNPADSFGVRYEPACLDKMLDDLTIEGRVEPSQLSIVCDRFWSKAVSAHGETKPAEKTLLTLAELEKAGSVEGLLEAIVADTLAGLDMRERLEALDVIADLQSRRGGLAVRQILREDTLKRRALRTTIRDRVVEKLKARYFLRLHRYRGSTLIEVTHEALLRAFNKALEAERQRHPAFFQMRNLLDRLRDHEEQLVAIGDWPMVHLRDLEEIEDIAAYVDWIEHPGICELVLRSWLALDATRSPGWSAAIVRWSGRLGEAAAAEKDTDPREAFLRYPSRWRLKALESEPDREWSEEERGRMVRVLIQLDHSAHADLTSRWTKRVRTP